MNETMLQEEVQEQKKRRFRLPTIRWNRRKKILAGGLALVVLAGVILPRLGGNTAVAGAGYQTAVAERRDLTLSVAGSATLEPTDSYQVTTLVSGNILSAPFEEGDLVEQGALLYALDHSDAQSSVDRANLSTQQARLSYEQALEALHPTSPIAGIIQEIFVHNGDSVSAGTALAKVITSTDLSVDFLFPYTKPSDFYVGQSATVFIGEFDAPVQGTVETVSDDTTITSDGRECSSVRVKLTNPGVVSETYNVSATIGSFCSYGRTHFSMPGSATIYAASGGTVTGLDRLAGSAVSKGETLCTIESESNRSQVENARLSVESARLSAGSASANLEDYNITSPISGTVIEKNFKAGDKVDSGRSGALATIYDLSRLKAEMKVNELDIGKVEAGQQVEVTAAALPGQVFYGTVDRISVNGTTTDGFTTYPVTISISEYGALKPGMNISATILCGDAKQVLTVPVSAVNRGNTVLVPTPGAMAEDGVTVVDPSLLEERPVSLGHSDDNYIEITSGLTEGETVLYIQQADPAMMGG
ncbi:MAG: efflux RND transporter periplasmic adaptor subunit [Oscillibacter sp.]|nr:efflux RND transporter periplasmic adaptor subunit [Oscillibacter sp.]